MIDTEIKTVRAMIIYQERDVKRDEKREREEREEKQRKRKVKKIEN